MHFIVAWLCVVRRGKGTGQPSQFNYWLSTTCGGGMGCDVRGHVCMCECVYAHLVPVLYEDPTSLRADNCTYTHTHTHIHTYIPTTVVIRHQVRRMELERNK
jgi:hypothetical protein